MSISLNGGGPRRRPGGGEHTMETMAEIQGDVQAPYGRDLGPVLQAMLTWGSTHVPGTLSREEIEKLFEGNSD